MAVDVQKVVKECEVCKITTHGRTAGYGAGLPKVVHRLYGTIPEDQSWEFGDFCMPRPATVFDT